MGQVPSQISEYMSSLGAKGGRSRSPEKSAAARENARKARQARYSKLKKKLREAK